MLRARPGAQKFVHGLCVHVTLSLSHHWTGCAHPLHWSERER